MKNKYWLNNKCADCGKLISYLATYCSSCAKKGKRSNRYNDGVSLKQYFCKLCGKEISYQVATYGKGCCRKCSYIVLRKQHKKRSPEAKEKMRQAKLGKFGALAANWQGGISFAPYPLGWTKTFKEQIRHRDGYKCRECGCHEVENGRRLDIHHIDYDKENLDSENLLSLCHRCHMKTNGNRECWIAYFMEMVWTQKI